MVTLNKRSSLCAEDRKLLTHSLQIKVTIRLQPLRSTSHLLYTWSPVGSTAGTNQNLDETEADCGTRATL